MYRIRRGLRLSLFASVSCVAPPLLAAGDAAASGPMWMSAVQVVLALGCVIGLIYLSGWLVRRAGILNQRVGDLRLLGGVALGTRERLVVVEWQGRKLLLGVTAQQISALASEDGVVEVGAGKFGSELKQALNQDVSQ